jgi:hypothetical protein
MVGSTPLHEDEQPGTMPRSLKPQPMNTIKSLFVISFASASLSSCVVSDYPGGPATPVVTSLSFGIYDTLPDAYVGDAYYYRDHYYYGGVYQRGRYSYQGREYSDRYYHGGKYYYGGRHEHHSNQSPQGPGRPEHHPDEHGGGDGRNRDRR